MPQWILASASPRRKALLEALGLDVEVWPANVTERSDGAPGELVLANACLKRDEVARRAPAAARIIAADTVVTYGGRVLGKPRDMEEAREMLAALSGETHWVYTGVAATGAALGRSAEAYEVTEVTFRPLSEAMIETFVEAVQPLDRAGAYTVDGPGALLVERYNGCYQNVLGLPLVRLDRMLESIGLSLFSSIDADRATFL
ncbi:MAG: Maf family protein [Candidatus Hydrogenedentota bacterium]